MMDTMASKLDKSTILILLIPTVLVAAGLVLALMTRDVRVIAPMSMIVGALVMGFVQARRARRDAAVRGR